MKTKLFLCLATSFLFYSCSGDEADGKKEEKKSASEKSTESSMELTDGEYFFQGMIDHKYAFHMMMEVRENKISGSYYYDSQKKELHLEGNIVDANLELDEMYKGKVTGHFTSDIFTLDSISGKWKSPKGKVMEFALFNSSKTIYYSSMKEPEQNWTKPDFENWLSEFPKVNLPFETEADGEDLGEDKAMKEDFVLLFLNPDLDMNDEMRETYSYTASFVTDNYIAVLYTEHYYPGAFGINNHSLMMKTFTPEGKLIDQKYLGCSCFDNNMDDYYQTHENFSFSENKILITGEETYASQEWAAEENLPVFEEITPVKKEIRISSTGEFEN